MQTKPQNLKDEAELSNVFIKFLPSEVNDAGLYSLFSQFGEIVSCKVMVDTQTGASLGYGFCRFAQAESAMTAIQTMNGMPYRNKTLLCKLSNPTVNKDNEQPQDNLYVRPLLKSTSESDLIALFSQFGDIKDCKVMINKSTGLSRQIGFVRFEKLESAVAAVNQLNGYQLEKDAPGLIVKFAETSNQKVTRKSKISANQSAAAQRGVLPPVNPGFFPTGQAFPNVQQQQQALRGNIGIVPTPLPFPAKTEPAPMLMYPQTMQQVQQQQYQVQQQQVQHQLLQQQQQAQQQRKQQQQAQQNQNQIQQRSNANANQNQSGINQNTRRQEPAKGQHQSSQQQNTVQQQTTSHVPQGKVKSMMSSSSSNVVETGLLADMAPSAVSVVSVGGANLVDSLSHVTASTSAAAISPTTSNPAINLGESGSKKLNGSGSKSKNRESKDRERQEKEKERLEKEKEREKLRQEKEKEKKAKHSSQTRDGPSIVKLNLNLLHGEETETFEDDEGQLNKSRSSLEKQDMERGDGPAGDALDAHETTASNTDETASSSAPHEASHEGVQQAGIGLLLSPPSNDKSLTSKSRENVLSSQADSTKSAKGKHGKHSKRTKSNNQAASNNAYAGVTGQGFNASAYPTQIGGDFSHVFHNQQHAGLGSRLPFYASVGGVAAGLGGLGFGYPQPQPRPVVPSLDLHGVYQQPSMLGVPDFVSGTAGGGANTKIGGQRLVGLDQQAMGFGYPVSYYAPPLKTSTGVDGGEEGIFEASYDSNPRTSHSLELTEEQAARVQVEGPIVFNESLTLSSGGEASLNPVVDYSTHPSSPIPIQMSQRRPPPANVGGDEAYLGYSYVGHGAGDFTHSRMAPWSTHVSWSPVSPHGWSPSPTGSSDASGGWERTPRSWEENISHLVGSPLISMQQYGGSPVHPDSFHQSPYNMPHPDLSHSHSPPPHIAQQQYGGLSAYPPPHALHPHQMSQNVGTGYYRQQGMLYGPMSMNMSLAQPAMIMHQPQSSSPPSGGRSWKGKNKRGGNKQRGNNTNSKHHHASHATPESEENHAESSEQTPSSLDSSALDSPTSTSTDKLPHHHWQSGKRGGGFGRGQPVGDEKGMQGLDGYYEDVRSYQYQQQLSQQQYQQYQYNQSFHMHQLQQQQMQMQQAYQQQQPTQQAQQNRGGRRQQHATNNANNTNSQPQSTSAERKQKQYVPVARNNTGSINASANAHATGGGGVGNGAASGDVSMSVSSASVSMLSSSSSGALPVVSLPSQALVSSDERKKLLLQQQQREQEKAENGGGDFAYSK